MQLSLYILTLVLSQKMYKCAFNGIVFIYYGLLQRSRQGVVRCQNTPQLRYSLVCTFDHANLC